MLASFSAARRKIAARSSNGIAAHPGFAASAASIAASISLGPAWWKTPSLWRRSCGIHSESRFPVRSAWPPATTGTSTWLEASAASFFLIDARSGLPGA